MKVTCCDSIPGCWIAPIREIKVSKANNSINNNNNKERPKSFAETKSYLGAASVHPGF